MLDFRKYMGYYDPKYPAIDFNTPWGEFNSYIECCKSLNQTPSLRRYFGYRNYLKTIGIIE
jgi:hypothetical protein